LGVAETISVSMNLVGKHDMQPLEAMGRRERLAAVAHGPLAAQRERMASLQGVSAAADGMVVSPMRAAPQIPFSVERRARDPAASAAK
jgi:hypothetical protein